MSNNKGPYTRQGGRNIDTEHTCGDKVTAVLCWLLSIIFVLCLAMAAGCFWGDLI